MITNRLLNTATLLLLLFASHAFAAPKTVTLPPETVQLKQSVHPGYVIAQQKCSICHSADYINLQPPGMSLSQWTKEVTKMQHAYGAPITDDDIKNISAYLTSSYGSEKLVAVMPSKAAVATPAKTVGNTVDIKTIGAVLDN